MACPCRTFASPLPSSSGARDTRVGLRPSANGGAWRARQAGQREPLVAGLPGLPDGIARAPRGGFWLGLVFPGRQAYLRVLPFRCSLRALPAAAAAGPHFFGCFCL